MNEFLAENVEGTEVSYDAGAEILRQGERSGRLYVLRRGKVEVVKNGVRISVANEAGSVFGELSILLDSYHNATVRTLEPSQFKIIENGDRFLENNPAACYRLANMLARRLANIDAVFAELKTKLDATRAQVNGQ